LIPGAGQWPGRSRHAATTMQAPSPPDSFSPGLDADRPSSRSGTSGSDERMSPR
jgi:hypothetical protein